MSILTFLLCILSRVVLRPLFRLGHIFFDVLSMSEGAYLLSTESKTALSIISLKVPKEILNFGNLSREFDGCNPPSKFLPLWDFLRHPLAVQDTSIPCSDSSLAIGKYRNFSLENISVPNNFHRSLYCRHFFFKRRYSGSIVL